MAFSAYVWWIIKQFGILPSISQSWYEEANVKGKKKKFMFILFIVSISAATLLLYSKSLWFLGSGASLLIVAFAPAFRSDHKIVGVLHTGGTVAGIAFGCYALVTEGIYFTTVLCVVGSILPERLKIDNTTWWTEVACFSAIELGIYQMMTLHL